MSARIVTEEVRFTWDHASQRLPRGQVIDVPEGSALERAIGTGNLVPMFGAPPAAPAPPPVVPAAPPTAPPAVPQAAASKPAQAEAPAPKIPAKATAKGSSDEGGGDG